jgi:hypothetical protein
LYVRGAIYLRVLCFLAGKMGKEASYQGMASAVPIKGRWKMRLQALEANHSG